MKYNPVYFEPIFIVLVAFIGLPLLVRLDFVVVVVFVAADFDVVVCGV